MVPGEPPAPLAVAVDHLAELAPNGVPDATTKTPTVGAAYLGHENPHFPLDASSSPWCHRPSEPTGGGVTHLNQRSDIMRSRLKIYCNVMTRCLTALSFAAGEELGPVHLYGNLIDLRLPTLGIRRTSASSPGTDSLRRGHFFKDGVNEGQIELFHNTCIVLDPGAKVDNPNGLTDAGYAYFIHPEESQPRRGFNNIL